MNSRVLMSLSRITLSALALLASVSRPAEAQSDRPGPWQVEAVVGRFDSDLELDEDPAFGFRLVRDTGARWSFEGQVLRLSGDDERDFAIILITPPPPGAFEHVFFDYDAVALDLSARLRLLAEDSPIQLHLLAGPGWGFVDAEARFRLSSGAGQVRIRSGGALDDSFTAHAGFALSFNFAKRWYLRFDGRARYWNERAARELDREWTVGVGFRL